MTEAPLRRLLMTTDTAGGVWTFTRELARELSSRGMEVVLAALGGAPLRAQAEEVESLPGVCLLSSDFKLEWMEDPWDDVAESGRWLLDVEEEYAPDAVHLNSFGHGALPWRGPVVTTAHSCVLSWWQAVRGERAPDTWNRYRELVTRSLRMADAVTAPSRALAATLAENYGFPLEACVVIPNGCRLPSGTEQTPKEPFIFGAGRLWDEGKNAAALAGVAEGLAWPVYLAGDAQQARFGACHTLGRLSETEMAGWYARAAIYALPARYEPFGLSILEAALSSCALVLGDIPSLRELWGDCALFVPPEDFDALRDALRELMGNIALREQLSARSFARAQTYDPARTAGRYLELYQRVGQCVS